MLRELGRRICVCTGSLARRRRSTTGGWKSCCACCGSTPGRSVPELLGVIGEDLCGGCASPPAASRRAFKYFLSPGHDADGVPYVVEIAICPLKTWVDGKAAKAAAAS